MRRGLTVTIVALLVLCPLLLTTGAGAATLKEKQDEARRLQSQIDALKAQSELLAIEYGAAVTELEGIRYSVDQNSRRLEEAQKDYEKALDVLQTRLKAMYIANELDPVEVLLEASDINDFLTRADYMSMIGNRDSSVLGDVRELREEISHIQSDLEEKQNRQTSVVSTIAQKQAQLEQSLSAQQSLLSSANAEIKKLMDELNRARTPAPNPNNGGGGGGTAPVIGTFVFPVAGPHSYSNDWHAPRRGHLHQGTDIFASMGTPTVACVPGTVQWGEGGNAGIYVRLVGDDGNVYYYMHLQRYAQAGHVPAGTIIGYVGDSGNAQGGPPHLHFEIHPGGGAAVNPYPTLRAHDG
ncbi:MAG: murein hydrolase activator EnvC family protein [Candidatus Geothermincolia bacterium]